MMVLFAGPYALLLAIVLVALVCWPFAVKLARGARRAGRLGVRRSSGALLCPECGEGLATEAGKAPATDLCPGCEGRWCAAAALAQGTDKPALSAWMPYKSGYEKQPLPCPRCAATMRCGSFPGTIFTTFRCEACDGFWFSRVDWTSFELSRS